MVASTAEARHRPRHRQHGGVSVRFHAGVHPSYGWSSGYRGVPRGYYGSYWGGDYGYDNGYGYDSGYGYDNGYYDRYDPWYDDGYPIVRYRTYVAPRVTFHFHGSRRCYRSHRHHRFRW
jgi:hypothetical protein